MAINLDTIGAAMDLASESLVTKATSLDQESSKTAGVLKLSNATADVTLMNTAKTKAIKDWTETPVNVTNATMRS